MKKAIMAGDEDGDWYGLYLEGEIVDQGHSVNLREVLAHFGYELEYKDVDGSYGRTGSYFPDNLADVNWAEEEW